jgi:predicted GNAT family N-acyltransferase
VDRRPEFTGGDVRVEIADFDADNVALRRIRFAVFVGEQNVPEDIEIDDRDPVCVHVLAYAGGKAVGTGRIDVESSGLRSGKVGRVAVLSEARRQGVGAAIMRTLHRIAANHGLDSVWCNAQVGAAAFYERLGYRVSSEPFYEAGIEHVRMERPVDD